ncbi:hypothetical protein GFC01_12095 [Desulfofundulus thermobenzoicus]|uniref:DnaD N-terminal domain-containing protein n=1 Tax=Desulfofundulus thermobenzoicus TaxID=29376 RepID=A0A6N7IU59_9FIRM|nr:hypothetical protein [Desulfofundulus thermobenzoicus]MQL52987.1 hypothetical protein [Desulfofundulus thermobenzoicus]
MLNQNQNSVNSNSKFYELYGKTILSEGVAPIPTALFRYQKALGLSFQEVSFVCHLLSYRWTSNDPHPSIEKLSVLTGVSAKSLHKYKNSLIEKGKLIVKNRYAQNGGQTTNEYDLTPLFTEIEKLIMAKEENNNGTIGHSETEEGCVKITQGGITLQGGYEKITYPPITGGSQGGITPCSHELDNKQVDSVVVELPYTSNCQKGGELGQPVPAALNELPSVVLTTTSARVDEYNPVHGIPTSDQNILSEENVERMIEEIAGYTGVFLSKQFVFDIFEKYGPEKIREKLQILLEEYGQRSCEVENLEGLLLMALKKNYQRTRCRFSGSGKMIPNDGKSKAGGKRKMDAVTDLAREQELINLLGAGSEHWIRKNMADIYAIMQENPPEIANNKILRRYMLSKLYV